MREALRIVAALPYTPVGAGDFVAEGPDTDTGAAAVAEAVGYAAAYSADAEAYFAHVEACSAHVVAGCTSQVAAYMSSHSLVVKAEVLAAYAVVPNSSLHDEEHSLTLVAILVAAVAEVCAGAVYFGNARRSGREAKPRELVACAETPPEIGNAAASWGALPMGGLRP